MNLDPLSFAIGKHGDFGPVRDVVSYLIARAVGIAEETWETLTNVAVATFTAVAAPLRGLTVSIVPLQDLHGQSAPYPPGGGKNKLNPANVVAAYISTTAGESYSSFRASSGNSRSVYQVLPAGTYTLSATGSCTFIIGVYPGNALPAYGTTTQLVYEVYSDDTPQSNHYTITLEQTSCVVLFIVSGSRDYDVEHSAEILAHIQYEIGSTATDFAPYSNICPISGWSAVTVSQSGEDTSDPETVVIQLGQTVYGGTLDVTTGVLTITHMNIASYNGETINEPWISSMDVYESGATPTTGAQVVYPLTTPQTVQLSPTEITTLLGVNNIWADTGNIDTITFRVR